MTLFRLSLFGVFSVALASSFGLRISSNRGCRPSLLRMAAKGTPESLVPWTLDQMSKDSTFIETQEALRKVGQKTLTLEERKARYRSLHRKDIPSFDEYLKRNNVNMSRLKTKILQMNIGLYCNQACNHCHVESSPARTELMSKETIQRCLDLLDRSPSITTVDITGGAPEFNPLFRWLVEEARKRGKEVIDRCNLTVLLEPGQEDLLDFLVINKVRIVASLPCYTEDNVDKQRGKGVFGRSIIALQMLNSRGYGKPGSDLVLDLVYNPGGAFLPGSQKSLEDAYREKLGKEYEITFDHLLTITNMPIKRFADQLIRNGELEKYMTLLVNNFNPSAASGVMCRDTLSVGWDGQIFDCDFNQQLQLPLGIPLADLDNASSSGSNTDSSRADSSSTSNDDGTNNNITKEDHKGHSKTVFDIESADDILKESIVLDLHCFGCTAGAGSSCQGATAANE